MSIIRLAYECPRCPGTGVVPPRRPGIDWPEPCTCGARKTLTQYQLARLLDEYPSTIVRLHEVRAGDYVSMRIAHKLYDMLRFGTVSRFGPISGKRKDT